MKILLTLFTVIFFNSSSEANIKYKITDTKINGSLEDECKEIKDTIEIYLHNYFYNMKTPNQGILTDEKRIQAQKIWLNPTFALVSIKNGICKN